MATHITGNGDGPNGEHDTDTIVGRGVVTRAKLVAEVEAGLHPNHSIYPRNGVEYVRSNPDKKETNNIKQGLGEFAEFTFIKALAQTHGGHPRKSDPPRPGRHSERA